MAAGSERRPAPAAPARTVKTFRFKAGEVHDDGSFSGYGSVFNVVDSYGDIVLPGAFAQSLQAHRGEGRMPAMLWQHDPCYPIGVWTEMAEDENGLFCRGRLVLEAEKALSTHALMKAGALDGLSIGYDVTDFEYGVPDEMKAAAAGSYRLLKAVDLWEVSVVTFPACQPSRVETVKAEPPPFDARSVIAALSRRDRALRELLGSPAVGSRQ